jgi:hypothetical protein
MTPTLHSALAAQATEFRGTPKQGHFRTKKPPMSLSVSIRGLLLNAAMLAVSRGLDADALAIKQVLIGLGIDRKQLGMAMALTKLQRGEWDACLQVLESEVLSQEPGHELALAVQSRVWQLQGLPKGRALANVLLVSSVDPVAREMARASI